MIDLDVKSRKILVAILEQYIPGIEVRVFGSRVNGTAKPYSDIDLVLDGKQPIPIKIINELKFALSNSDLPIMVDLVDRYAISEEFKQIIDKNNQLLISAM